MDAKALAKSKRAHSLQHKKKHQSQQGLKASSPSAGSDFKQAGERPAKSHGQQAKERSLQLQNSRAIPSNWNRYGDDDSSLASENARESSSKGADYAHMISEAQLDYSSDAVPLFDDFIGDLCRTLVRCLLPRGEACCRGLLMFEDDARITSQAPFLSLNLDALAEQLAKAKLSERLYLQSDLLPLELLDEARGQDKQAPQTATSASSLSNDQAVTATGEILVQTSKEQPNPSKKNTDQILQLQATNRSNSTSGKPSKFEKTAAEAELDKLLNSFSDTAVPREQRIPLSGVWRCCRYSSGGNIVDRIIKCKH